MDSIQSKYVAHTQNQLLSMSIDLFFCLFNIRVLELFKVITRTEQYDVITSNWFEIGEN